MGAIHYSFSYEGDRRDFDLSKRIGFCIYCGKNDCELTDEHVAPEGLQGDVLLREASCKSCADLTGYSELRVSRGPLAIVRETQQLYGKRRSGKRPEKLTLEIRRRDWTIEKLVLPVAEFPFVFRMPRFPAPRRLQPARQHDADYHGRFDYRQFDTLDGLRKGAAIIDSDLRRDRLQLDMNVYELSKVLAKIAYGFSIVLLGPYSIKPYVTELIIAPKDTAPSFLHDVGGAFVGEDRIESLTTTDLGKVVVRTELVRGNALVLARVQLLGHLGAPVYEVVVGELVDQRSDVLPLVPVDRSPSMTYDELRLWSGRITADAPLMSRGDLP